MPILIQCTNCKRNLRVQDHLLGKTVKCPNCQSKFRAQLAEENPAPSTALEPSPSSDADAALGSDAPVRSLAEQMMQTPLLPLIDPAAGLPGSEVPLDVTQPASSNSGKATSGPREQVAAVPVMAAAQQAIPEAIEVSAPTPQPRPPQPFQTPVLRVLGVIGGLVMLAVFIGCALGWLVGAAVENAAIKTLAAP
jgi:hypothetical protein